MGACGWLGWGCDEQVRMDGAPVARVLAIGSQLENIGTG